MQKALKLFFMLFMTMMAFSVNASFEEDSVMDFSLIRDSDPKEFNKVVDQAKSLFSKVFRGQFDFENKTPEIKKTKDFMEDLDKKKKEKECQQLENLKNQQHQTYLEQKKVEKESEQPSINKSESSSVDDESWLCSPRVGKAVVGGTVIIGSMYVIYQVIFNRG